MTEKKLRVEITENFEQVLASVEDFWKDRGYLQGFDALLEDLEQRVVPSIIDNPRIGADFFKRRNHTEQERITVERILIRIAKQSEATDIREFIAGHYLVLYAVIADTLFLLSIRHHKQQVFSFKVDFEKV